MTQKIIPLSGRGQITLPKKIREQIHVKFFTCEIAQGNILLKPLKTREEFFTELEEADQDWEKHGGVTLQEMKKKYRL